MPKLKYVIYKQQDRVIAKTLTLGVSTDMQVKNLPQSFEFSEIVSSVVREPIQLNGEKMLFLSQQDMFIYLQNQKNEQCQFASLVPIQEISSFIIFGFAKFSVKTNYKLITTKLINTLNTEKLFQVSVRQYSDVIIEKIQNFNFSLQDEIVF